MGRFFAGKKSSVSFIAYLRPPRITELETALKPGVHISRNDRKHMVANTFIKFLCMSWSSHNCNDCKYLYFIKILFETMPEACSVIVMTQVEVTHYQILHCQNCDFLAVVNVAHFDSSSGWPLSRRNRESGRLFCRLNPSSTLLFLYIPQTLFSLLTVISAHLSPICWFNPFHRPCSHSQQSLLHIRPPFCSLYAFHRHCSHS